MESVNWRIIVQPTLSTKQDLVSKISKVKKAGELLKL
jgi:hypothetical protein